MSHSFRDEFIINPPTVFQQAFSNRPKACTNCSFIYYFTEDKEIIFNNTLKTSNSLYLIPTLGSIDYSGLIIWGVSTDISYSMYYAKQKLCIT